MNKILVVDDESSIRESFALILEGKYDVLTAASGEAALKIVSDQKLDLVYLDIRMPGMDGLETLKKLKEIDPAIDVVMVTAVNEVSKASDAIRRGARDYLVKPFDVDSIQRMTSTILRRKNLLLEGKEVQKESRKLYSRLVGQSEKIIEIDKLLKKIAGREFRILILGETGTEKEAVAETIHEQSTRSALPMASLPLTSWMSAAMIENRIFGRSKGSTVTTLERSPGLVDEARGGTLFLNYVENLPTISEQLKNCPLRLIAGSSQLDLAESKKEIFDYFSEAVITLPPLRERLSDLPLLTTYFLERFNLRYGKEIKGLTEESETVFSNYDWPGNTAQLELILENAVLVSQEERIGLPDLPLDLQLGSGSLFSPSYADEFEKQFVGKIFELAGRDKNRAAAALKISTTLLEGKL